MKKMYLTIKRLANGKQVSLPYDKFFVGDKQKMDKNLDEIFEKIPNGEWYVMLEDGSLVDVGRTNFRGQND